VSEVPAANSAAAGKPAAAFSRRIGALVVPLAGRAGSSRAAASFLPARAALAATIVHCARKLNLVSNQEYFRINV
jgi:hypothetical protein